MIGIREMVTVRLEVEFEVLVGELGILEQNALDLDLEELIVIWGDQITQTRLMVLLRKLENPTYANKSSKRNARGVGRGQTKLEAADHARQSDAGAQVADPTSTGHAQILVSEMRRTSPDDSSD